MTGKHKLPDVFSQHPQVMIGALVFKGTRVPVQTFFDHLDHGGTLEEFLEWYDGVTREQLAAAEEIRAAARSYQESWNRTEDPLVGMFRGAAEGAMRAGEGLFGRFGGGRRDSNGDD